MGTTKKTTRRTRSNTSSRPTEVKNEVDPEIRIGFITGAVRSARVAGGNKGIDPDYTLICPTALKSLAITMADGAEKYGKFNYTEGIPNSNSLNHAMAHLQEYLVGDRSEDHLGHAMANIQFIIHFNHSCGCAAGFKLLEATNVGT